MRTPICWTASLMMLTLLLASGGALADAMPPATGAAGVAPGFVKAARKSGGSGVALSYRVEPAAADATHVDVTLRFAAVTAVGATARLYSPAPMQIDRSGPFPLNLGAETEIRVRMTPPAPGHHQLNVQTEQSGRISVVAIPIVMGQVERTMSRDGKLLRTPSGEAVISLPSK